MRKVMNMPEGSQPQSWAGWSFPALPHLLLSLLRCWARGKGVRWRRRTHRTGSASVRVPAPLRRSPRLPELLLMVPHAA